MAIRLGHSCANCKNFINQEFCSEHQTAVSTRHTCDSFEMLATLKNDPNCLTCSRYEGPTCAYPQKAAPNMLCSQWAPQSATA